MINGTYRIFSSLNLYHEEITETQPLLEINLCEPF